MPSTRLSLASFKSQPFPPICFMTGARSGVEYRKMVWTHQSAGSLAAGAVALVAVGVGPAGSRIRVEVPLTAQGQLTISLYETFAALSVVGSILMGAGAIWALGADKAWCIPLFLIAAAVLPLWARGMRTRHVPHVEQIVGGDIVIHIPNAAASREVLRVMGPLAKVPLRDTSGPVRGPDK